MISIPPSVSPSSVDANRPRRRHSGGTRDAGGRSEIPPKDLEIPPSLRATPKTKVYPFFYLPFSFAETGPNRLTVGKIYGGMLILENWKMTRFAALPPARKGLPVSPTNYVRCLPTSPVYDSGMPRATMCASCRDLNLPFSASCRGQVEPKQQALGHVDVPSLSFPRMRARHHTTTKKRELGLYPQPPFCRLPPPPPRPGFISSLLFPELLPPSSPLFQFSELPNGGERRQQLEDTQCVRTYVRT